jgi:hypothetical protein
MVEGMVCHQEHDEPGRNNHRALFCEHLKTWEDTGPRHCHDAKQHGLREPDRLLLTCNQRNPTDRQTGSHNAV